MKEFLKENALLVAGIALPLILTALFFIALETSKASIDPPHHDVLFTSNHYGEGLSKNIIVKKGQLYLSFIPPKETVQNHYNNQALTLHLYSISSNTTRKIALPDTSDLTQKTEILIEETADLKISEDPISPDGYTFSQKSSGNSNIMTELFGGGSNYNGNFVLQKGAQIIPVLDAPQYSSRFLGWVVETASTDSKAE